MKFEKQKINGVVLIEFEKKSDDRGFFMRCFCKQELKAIDIGFDIIQINRSFNYKKGTVRGLHFQKKPFAEDKIVQVLQGKIFDVVVDLRKRSSTYKKWIGVQLSEENQKALFIPKGCAHGFQTLVNNCELEYFMSEYYSPDHSSGINLKDPTINIKWPLPIKIISNKDNNLPNIV